MAANSKIVFIFGIFLSLIIVYEDGFKYAGYVALAICIPVSLLVKFCGASKKLKSPDHFDKGRHQRMIVLLSGAIVYSWLYGASVGFSNGANIRNSISNFFGLLLYVIYPVYLIIRPSSAQVGSVLVFAGLFQLVVAIISFDPNKIGEYNLVDLGSISDVRSSYSAGYSLVFPLFSAACGVVFFNAGNHLFFFKLTSFIIILMAFFVLTVVTASKGFILAMAFISMILLVSFFVNAAKGKYLMLLFMATAALFFGIYGVELFDLLMLSFSLREGGNEIRAEQSAALISELHFFGAGLGTRLGSGYVRDDTGYGFELTYLNLIQKLGVFSAPLLLMYLYTFYQSIAWLFRDCRSIWPYLCLGGCGYMIVGIGNPLLLAPFAVSLHCSVLYLITKGRCHL